MGLLNHLFDSDWRQRNDLENLDEIVAEVIRWTRTNHAHDVGQDARLTRLERENAELRASLVALVSLLSRKGTLTHQDLQMLSRAVSPAAAE